MQKIIFSHKSESYWKLLVKCIICAIAVVISKISGIGIFSYGALGLYLCMFIFTDIKDVFSVFMFFLPWTVLLKISPETFSFTSIAFLIVLIRILFKTRGEFEFKSFLLIFAIAFITCIVKLVNNYPFSMGYVTFFLSLIMMIIFCENYTSEVSFEQLTVFYAVGIISAAAISMMTHGNPNINQYMRVFENEMAVQNQTVNIQRQCGFYPDPNYFASQVSTALGCVLLISNRTRLKSVVIVGLVIALIAFGMTSVSKSFMISVVLILGIWLLTIFKSNTNIHKSFRIITILFMIVLVALMNGTFSNLFIEYSARFSTTDNVTSLTTGRSDIWKEYITFLLNNPFDLCFGQGLTSVLKAFRKGSHNTIIQIFYQLGIFGTLFLSTQLGIVLSIVKKKKKVGRINLILLTFSCFFMWMGIDVLMWDDFPLIIGLYIMGINYLTTDNVGKRTPVK